MNATIMAYVKNTHKSHVSRYSCGNVCVVEKKTRSNARHKSFWIYCYHFLVQMKIEDNRGQKGINLIVILEIPIISKAKIATTKLG